MFMITIILTTINILLLFLIINGSILYYDDIIFIDIMMNAWYHIIWLPILAYVIS